MRQPLDCANTPDRAPFQQTNRPRSSQTEHRKQSRYDYVRDHQFPISECACPKENKYSRGATTKAYTREMRPKLLPRRIIPFQDAFSVVSGRWCSHFYFLYKFLFLLNIQLKIKFVNNFVIILCSLFSMQKRSFSFQKMSAHVGAC